MLIKGFVLALEAVVFHCEPAPLYTSALRIRALMMSSTITVTTTIIICAAVSPY